MACAIARAIDVAPEALLSPPEALNRPISLAAEACRAARRGTTSEDDQSVLMLRAMLPGRLHALPPASVSCLASLRGVLMLGLRPPRSGEEGAPRLTRQHRSVEEAHRATKNIAAALGYRILRISDCGGAQVVGSMILTEFSALFERGAWEAACGGCSV